MPGMRTRITYLQPAHSVIEAFGGVDKVSTITGKHISRVYRWMYPKEQGGTGGIIPQPEAAKLLKHARDNGVAVTADSFFASAA